MANKTNAQTFNLVFYPDDERSNRVQVNIRQSLESILALPFINGVLLSAVNLVSTSVNFVSHGLGQPPNGFIVVRSYYAGDLAGDATPVEDTSITNIDRTQVLPLRVDRDVSVSLWVW